LSEAFSSEVNNAWSYTSTPPYLFTAWCLVTHRDSFTFISRETSGLYNANGGSRELLEVLS